MVHHYLTARAETVNDTTRLLFHSLEDPGCCELRTCDVVRWDIVQAVSSWCCAQTVWAQPCASIMTNEIQLLWCIQYQKKFITPGPLDVDKCTAPSIDSIGTQLSRLALHSRLGTHPVEFCLLSWTPSTIASVPRHRICNMRIRMVTSVHCSPHIFQNVPSQLWCNETQRASRVWVCSHIPMCILKIGKIIPGKGGNASPGFSEEPDGTHSLHRTPSSTMLEPLKLHSIKPWSLGRGIRWIASLPRQDNLKSEFKPQVDAGSANLLRSTISAHMCVNPPISSLEMTQSHKSSSHPIPTE